MQRYKAVKVLTVSESGIDNPQPNYTHELDILAAVRRNKSKMRCVIPRMDDHFSQKGPHGEHYCFVLPVMGISLQTFRTASPSDARKAVEQWDFDVIVAQGHFTHSLYAIQSALLNYPHPQAVNRADMASRTRLL